MINTNSNCLARDKVITARMIGLHVGMTMLLVLLFSIITDSWLIGTPLGIIIWTFVLFKTPMFDWSFFNVKPNHALIVGNQTTWDIIPEKTSGTSNKEDERVKMFALASMREIQPGVRGKKWTEVVYESIDLRREAVIGNGANDRAKLTCYTDDGIPLDIKWQAILTPLRGNLVNLIRNGEEAALAFFRGEFEQFLINWISRTKEDKVFEAVGDKKSEFSNLFGGELQVHAKEEEYGLFTNRPQLLRVKRSDSYATAAEAVEKSERVSTAIQNINDSFPGEIKPDASMVLATAAAMAGTEIPGLVLIPGLGGKGSDGREIAALIAATKTSKKGN